MQVRAKQRGFYDGSIREEGEEFILARPAQFSTKWMEKAEVPYKKPEPVKMPETFSEMIAQTEALDKKARKGKEA